MRRWSIIILCNVIDIKVRLERYRSQFLHRVQKVHDESLINFTANDYLNLARDPRVKASFKEGVDLYGLGSCSSVVVSGYTRAHSVLEEKFAEFLNCDQAILFNSGYHANLGVTSVLSNNHTHIIADKLCHASIIDGIKLARANLHRFRHNNLEHAKLLLSKIQEKKLVITESIFSMEGDIAPASELSELSSKYNANFIIDDAHAIGVLGKNGRGISEYYGLTQEEVQCIVVPLGKALASMGAIVAGKMEVIEALRQFARTYIYTTALPPAIPHATIEVLKIVEHENWRRERLNELITYFLESADNLGLSLTSKHITPIKSIVIGSNFRALKIQNYLLNNGFLISSIRPPTVPINTTRIRVSINCSHTESQILSLLQLIVKSNNE